METLMNTKKCFKFGKEKSIDDFYVHKEMADGHLNKCKECTKKDTAKNYRDNIVHYVEYEKERSKRPERKRKNREYIRRMKKKNPERFLACNKVSNAIRDGRLEREPCVICGESNTEAHHEDYSKPLDVVWLCRKHHLAIHYQRSYDQGVAV